MLSSASSRAASCFIDEIHPDSRPAEEMLYLAMEDFRVDVVVRKGPGATSIPLEVAPFTLVGATTVRRADRTAARSVQVHCALHMDFYEAPRTGTGAVALGRHPGHRALGREAGAEITATFGGHAAHRQPAAARVRDYAEVRKRTVSSPATSPRPAPARCTTSMNSGWTGWTARVLSALTRSFGGGPVGVDAGGRGRRGGHHSRGGLRAVPGAGRDDRAHPRGRVATQAARTHLGLTPPQVTGLEPAGSLGIALVGGCQSVWGIGKNSVGRFGCGGCDR